MDLRSCYEDVFTAGCGETGGRVIGGLMTEAFRDPFYLRYKYKPDCDLHRTTAAAVPATQATEPRAKVTSTDSRPQQHHKTVKTERSRTLKENVVVDAKHVASADGVRDSNAAVATWSRGTSLLLLTTTVIHVLMSH